MANINALFEKIKNKIRNHRNKKRKKFKSAINEKSLERAIKKPNFLKNMNFDIDKKDLEILSNQDKSFYNKYLDHEGSLNLISEF